MRSTGTVVCLFAALVASSCSSPPPPKEPASAQGAFGGCRIKVPESQDKPFIVEWDDAHRRALQDRLRGGVVVVHYEDCHLDILEKCTAKARYQWEPSTPKRHRISISTLEQLWANVPIGAPRLEEKLGAGEMTIESMRVGTWHVPERVTESSLQGDCKRATHVISSIATGAFEMRMGLGALAQRSESDEERLHAPVSAEGRFDACMAPADRAPPEQCSSPFRLEVSKILATSRPCRAGDRADCSHQCKNENEVSCQRLADMLRNDEDSERTALYKRGCERADLRACNNYGVMLVRGVAVAHDLPRARTFFTRACDSGLAEACSNAGFVLGRDEYGKPLEDPSADVRLREACAKKIGVACFALGARTDEDGKTLASPDGVALLKSACDLGYGPACARLAAVQRPKDRALAARLEDRACSLGMRSACPGHDPTSEVNELPWSELLLMPTP